MKKTFLTSTLSFALLSSAANAQVPTGYLDEVKALGAVAGQGLACGSPKYDTFEMLARAILITKAMSNAAQSEAMYAYSESKANAYFSKQMDGFFMCDDIINRFGNQDIFQAVLYADGTIKMPDGRIFSPRQPYDATLLHKKDEKERQKAQAIYDKGDNIAAGEITIKTDGNKQDIKAVYPGTKHKVEPIKSATRSSAPTAAAPVAQSSQPTQSAQPIRNNSAADLNGGIRHIKANR